ncbi:hypothetical protein AZ78_4397 [Lysobacter capsici AZ78]|uniref:Uncharacterized protein n=1 Tax=Lysobacter capsici AZ78 TaxID=1444315 RepID=A0A108UCV5_9GAMM|nr:hypothetical protein AZ78_4397 [Lysobacter capsici AZ78]
MHGGSPCERGRNASGAFWISSPSAWPHDVDATAAMACSGAARRSSRRAMPNPQRGQK